MGAVVLTVSEGSFVGLAHALRGKGLTVIERPLLRFTAPQDWHSLDLALNRLTDYEAMAFTSPRAVTATIERARLRNIPVPNDRLTTWATGPATAAALEGWSLNVRMPDQMSESVTAAALAKAIIASHTRGPVLFPCGELHRDDLPGILREAGVQVDEVVCYRSVLGSETEARAAADAGTLLVAGSPSVIGLLARACPDERPALLAVGPTTADAARRAGWLPSAVAAEPSVPGVLGAIDGLLTARS